MTDRTFLRVFLVAFGLGFGLGLLACFTDSHTVLSRVGCAVLVVASVLLFFTVIDWLIEHFLHHVNLYRDFLQFVWKRMVRDSWKREAERQSKEDP